MEKIPTAEEFLIESGFTGHAKHGLAKKWMVEFARLHVEAALKAAADNVEIQEYDGPVHLVTPIVNESSILNSYPLENIK